MMFNTLVVLFTFVFGLVQAASINTLYFEKRQFAQLTPSTIPPECSKICETTTKVMGDCGRLASINTSCLCTASNFASFNTCANCFAYVQKSTPNEIENVEEAINGLGKTCGAAGKTVPRVNIVATSQPAEPSNGADAVEIPLGKIMLVGMMGLYWL